MSNSPFIINDLPNNTWSVEWPALGNITKKVTGKKLLTMLFEDIKCVRVGIGIKFVNSDMDALWIESSVYWQDKEGLYTTYLEDMYEIGGVVFMHHHEAIKFQNILEKRYIWQLLKA